MSSKPLVSGIVPFLNTERFIREAVESVFAQTYDNWELLLVDDGSTDASTRIALEYAERYPGKVRYLEHPGHRNRGVSASRNLGIGHAEGQYVGFLDADDVWLPQALEQQVAILGSRPEAGMVYGSAQYWYGWTGDPEDSQRDFRDFVEEQGGVKPNTLLKPLAWLTAFLRAGGAAPCICSMLIRREVAKSTGGFEEELSQYEDQAFFVKVGLQAPVFVASGCWSKYRQHPDSSWHITQRTGQNYPTRLFFLSWLAEYLYEQGVEDAEVWKLLQEAHLQTHRRQLRARNKRVKELEGALEKERQKVLRLREQNRRLELQAQNQERQLQDMKGSRAWKLWERLDHLRARVLGR